jgi:membrane dipeptidase
MNRRDCLALLASAPVVMAAANAGKGRFSDRDYDRAIIIDGCSGFDDPYGYRDAVHFSTRAVAEMRQSGLTACTFTVAKVGNDPDVWDSAIRMIAEVDQMIADNSDILLKAINVADIRRAKAERRIAIFYHLQDTSLVGADLDRITVLKGLGARIVQLTYNIRNLSGDGCLELGDVGISKLGRATIARIEQEKLLLDLSHGNPRTVAEAIAAATRPMTISHTGCRAIHDNPRSQWDSELKACADKGGVVGIYWMPFLVADGHARSSDLLRHMKHALNVCGEDHVSIGTDGMLLKTKIDTKILAARKKRYTQRVAQGIAAPGEGPDVFNIVEDWDDHMRFRHLVDGLAADGWTSTQIEKVLGGNLMRLYAETWGG